MSEFPPTRIETESAERESDLMLLEVNAGDRTSMTWRGHFTWGRSLIWPEPEPQA
jgi:hypothetical protein